MKRILVIDDEGLVTTSLKQLLKKSGYDVDVAGDGHAAIDKVMKNDFDLIISDIRMPEMNGVEVIQKIRECLKEKGKPQIPEILITGYASKENLDEAKRLKVADYIYKPFNIKEFLDVVKRNLGEETRGA